MEKLVNLSFSPKPSTILHLDLNSCFATIEQQANPLLRGKPVAVAAYTTSNGCIIAPSVEAKKLGVKVGMRVRDGRLVCPGLVVLPPDPAKYRSVHQQLKQLLGTYTDQVTPKSIDEFVLDLEGSPAFARLGIWEVARQIKARIRAEIGEWLTVSIGIAPNRFLAKVAAGLHKPDGLDEINITSYQSVFQSLQLTDICGIKAQNAIRLNHLGIFSAWDFYRAPASVLKACFQSVVGWYWYLRLKGFEIDDVVFGRRSYGNSYALPDTRITPEDLAPILYKLVEKMAFRLRRAGYRARGVHLSLLYRDWSYWHRGAVQPELVFDSRDIYRVAYKLLVHSPYRRPVHTLAVSCFDLDTSRNLQLGLLSDIDKKDRLMTAVDRVNSRWGDFVITPARMLGTAAAVPDRIAFGGIKELEELIFSSPEI